MKFPSLKFEAGSKVIKYSESYVIKDIVYSTGTDTWYVIYFPTNDYYEIPKEFEYETLEEFENEFELL